MNYGTKPKPNNFTCYYESIVPTTAKLTGMQQCNYLKFVDSSHKRLVSCVYAAQLLHQTLETPGRRRQWRLCRTPRIVCSRRQKFLDRHGIQRSHRTEVLRRRVLPVIYTYKHGSFVTRILGAASAKGKLGNDHQPPILL